MKRALFAAAMCLIVLTSGCRNVNIDGVIRITPPPIGNPVVQYLPLVEIENNTPCRLEVFARGFEPGITVEPYSSKVLTVRVTSVLPREVEVTAMMYCADGRFVNMVTRPISTRRGPRDPLPIWLF